VWEHVFVTFADALLLLFELADKADKRFQPAAARWHARFVLVAQLPLNDSELMMKLLREISGPKRQIIRRRLLVQTQHAGLMTREIR
jgi:hypothetical protein